MSYANSNSKPPGSPWCWGPVMKYQDGDPECMQCAFKESCRNTVMQCYTQNPLPPRPPLPAPVSIPLPPKPTLPIYNPQLPILRPTYTNPNPTVPLPPQLPVPYQPQYPAQQQMAPPGSLQILDYNNPHPLAPMYRPGVQQPPYYPSLHPGESVKKRLGKNLVLRALEALFAELGAFFRHWTWPPKN